MGLWINPEEVKKAVTIEEVLNHFGIEVKWRNRPYFILCPFHPEKKPSFYVDVKDQLGYCFGCRRGGDVIRIAMEFLNAGFYEAAAYLAKTFNVVSSGHWKASESIRRTHKLVNLQSNRRLVNSLKASIRIDERARLPLVRRREHVFDELDRLLHEKGDSHPLAFLGAALELYFEGLALMASFEVEAYASFLKEAEKEHSQSGSRGGGSR